ncbi:hypothetical protein EPJ70_11615 [Brachyspira aalborgi]|uniref:Uncharacterized protein n=1 Tax=Brachyspira aalborgi TaxID=29522 RepID=A0A5C8F349_9SPIR|nr:hypothetical protein [Brachyspira aalborgi]TXJ42970.1 hypothetical protein EPJ70_11615 [Brachyspira aalborgi]
MNSNDKINIIVSDIESLIDKINLFYEKLYYLDIMRADVDEIHKIKHDIYDIEKDILEKVNIINEKYNEIKILCYEVNESKIKIINSHRIMESDINKIKLETDNIIIRVDKLEKYNLEIKSNIKSLSDNIKAANKQIGIIDKNISAAIDTLSNNIKAINKQISKNNDNNNKKLKELDDSFKKNILSLNRKLFYSNIFFILLFVILAIFKFLGKI